MDFPKSVPGVGLVNGKFIDEDPLAATPGSLIPSAWGNALTLEILNVLAEAGLVPDETDNAQLVEAINKLVNEAKVSFASQAEAEAGVVNNKAMSPLGVFQAIAKIVIQATENAFGWIKISTQAQVNAGADDNTSVTPKKLAVWFSEKVSQATEAVAGLAKVATQVVTNDGVDDTKIVTPKKLLGWVASGSTAATETLFGFIKLASASQATMGINDTAAMTPLKTAQALSASNTSQTLQNVIGSRSLGGSFNNNTGKTITAMVSILGTTGGETCAVTVGGVAVYTGDPGYGTTSLITFVVPHNASYSLDVNPKSGSNLQTWVELR
ncbi:hypothetical protein [Pseudomonas sp. EA_15y_Pfl1_P102]|uniref:hypothetical protein n=1 Tax=Pseudomonas sp. EA_15y_Pfl1_P102 TaxID=3088685 RepID=UPI0030DC4380